MLKKLITSLTLVLGISQSAYAIEPGEQLGNYGQYLISLVSVFAIASEHDNEGAWMYGKSLVTSTAVTYGLKRTVKSKRPRAPFSPDSFPSGHAAWTFTTAGYIHKRYGMLVGIPAYAAAGLIGYTRVHSHAHRACDVFAGAAIGVASSWVFTRPFSSEGVDIEAGPYADENSRGMEISARF